MGVGGKILAGAAATVLLALVAHQATADRFVSGLEKSAQTELTAQGMDNIQVVFDRDPMSRTAALDGEAPDDQKQKALSAVLSIPGVSSARWKGEEDVAIAATTDGGESDGKEPVDPETQAKISQCQTGVNKIVEAKKINFRSGSAYVSPASNKILDEVAAALKPCAGLAVAVSGHTDDNGDAGVNKTMSQERADRVGQGLVDRGIDKSLVTSTGYGSEKPLANGTDAQNRRIEFKIQASSADDANTQQGES